MNPKQGTPRSPGLRDRLAPRLANWCLLLGSPWYRDRVELFIWYGMYALERDYKQNPYQVPNPLYATPIAYEEADPRCEQC